MITIYFPQNTYFGEIHEWIKAHNYFKPFPFWNHVGPNRVEVTTFNYSDLGI